MKSPVAITSGLPAPSGSIASLVTSTVSPMLVTVKAGIALTTMSPIKSTRNATANRIAAMP